MSDVKGFTVVLERPMHADDAKELMEAIRWMKGVGDVIPSPDTIGDVMNREMARIQLRQQLLEVLMRKQ